MKYQEEDVKVIAMQFLSPDTGQVSIERIFTEVHACRANLRWYPFDTIDCAMVHILDMKVDKVVLQLKNNDEKNTEKDGQTYMEIEIVI